MKHTADPERKSDPTGTECQDSGRVPPPARPSLGRWLWEWTKSIVVAFLLFLFVRTFLVEAFQIPTGSMENTLLVGDFLLVNKAVYGAEIPGTDMHLPAFDRPSRGDIIVFEPPPAAGQPPHTNYVKRIVGIAGDTLAMTGGALIRNGRRVPEPYVKRGRRIGDVRSPQFSWQRSYLVGHRPRYRPTRDNWGPIVVPPHSLFVMGDNRVNSEDSRYWGFVPESSVKGRPLVIYYSYDRRKVVPFSWLTEIRWDRVLHGVR
ncbi:MAG: signal peptidase I [Gemmatimonadota bacterium]